MKHVHIHLIHEEVIRLWTGQRVRTNPVGVVEETDDVVERLEPVAEFIELSSENRVLCFNGQVVLRGDADTCHDLAVLFLELVYLSR